jgi:hypothetical protein
VRIQSSLPKNTALAAIPTARDKPIHNRFQDSESLFQDADALPLHRAGKALGRFGMMLQVH